MSRRSVLEIFKLTLTIGVLITSGIAQTTADKQQAPNTWQFAVSGDSRNCGNIVMPTIADSLTRTEAQFYWHLGDLRWTSDFDEDIVLPKGETHVSISDYARRAWPEFIRNQIEPFRVPFFVGIGNHETISPKSRTDFLLQFADWLTVPVLREQRLKDDPDDHKLRAYYHWRQGGVDLIYLDNATADQFDRTQLRWFKKVVEMAQSDPEVKAIVVGMHKALPDSISFSHSMSDYPIGTVSGRLVYKYLLEAQSRGKKIYILASHSHFYMENIFDSSYWRANGGVLPGWIVGTAGARRYKLPEGLDPSTVARINVYGYLLGTVDPPGEPAGTIRFEFKEVRKDDVTADTRSKFKGELIDWCFEKNTEAE